MEEHVHVTVDDKPVSNEVKKRIQESLKKTVQEELAKEHKTGDRIHTLEGHLKWS